ncbi:MAG: N-formylglutamate amidohydrolase, partial [Pseudobdellovibrio sp.]
SVFGSENKSGTHSRGYHWVVTTLNYKLMQSPISKELHNKLTDLIYWPFHDGVKALFGRYKKAGFKNVFHLDAHSMPSLGTKMHKDPGQYRADIVVSDCLGASCHVQYKDLVIESYKEVGFSVAYNWPYMGGRVTEQYGHPELGQQTLQVELNRALYMDEVTKKIKPDYILVQERIAQALERIKMQLPNLNI